MVILVGEVCRDGAGRSVGGFSDVATITPGLTLHPEYSVQAFN